MYNRLLSSIRHLQFGQHCRILSTQNRKPATLQQLIEQETDTILYSSFVDNLTPSWSRSSKQEWRARKQQNEMIRAAAQVKPFSLALKYMQEEKPPETNPNNSNTDTDTTVEDEAIDANSIPAEHSSTSWMNDYESYDDDADNQPNVGVYGTPDPSVPVSKIPCHGCGALLQCAEPSLPGYLPSEIFANQRADYLKTITCQRCHFLRHYNTVIDVTVAPAEYVRLISSIRDRFALAILMVDLTDLPNSIWPNIVDIIGPKRPVIIVGNKIDLLPRDSSAHLGHVLEYLRTAATESGIARTNIKHTCLISAETGYGIEELITKLHNVWSYRGDVYLLGCTNVGKSTLFNALLRSDYCKSTASDLISKATASQWPGTTMRMLKFPIMRPNDWRMYVRTKRILSQRGRLAEAEKLRRDQAQQTRRTEHATLIGHIDRTFRNAGAEETADSFGMGASRRAHPATLDERDGEFATSKWCYDTPGVVQPEQTLNLLTTAELLLTIPRRMLVPRTFRLMVGQTLFLAGLGRLDLEGLVGGSGSMEEVDDSNGSIRVTVYASAMLPVLIVDTEQAERMYAKFLGTAVLAVPQADDADDPRLRRWPTLVGRRVCVDGCGRRRAGGDVVLSSAGWVGVHAEHGVEMQFQVWTPEGRGIAKRVPALVPMGLQLSGARVRGSLAHQNRRAFVP